MRIILTLFWLGFLLSVAMYVFYLVIGIAMMAILAVCAGVAGLFNLIFKK